MDAATEPTPRRGPLAGIHRNVLTLGVTSFFTDVSTEMLIPILPLFITVTLGASATSLGVIEGFAESVASLLRTASGWFSDRTGRRRPFLVFGYGLSGAAKACIGFASAWPMVLVLRGLDRLGKGLRNPPRDALIADSTPPQDRGRAFGLHRAMDSLGAVAGPLLGGWLLSRAHGPVGEGYRSVFFFSAIPAALSVLALFALVKPPGAAAAAARKPAGGGGSLGPAFRRFVIVDAIFQLGNSSNAFVLLRTQGAGWGAAQVSLVYVAYNVMLAALSLPFGKLSDRIGRRPLLFAGYGTYALTYAVLAWGASRWGVVAAFLMLGVYTALFDGQSRAMIADLVPAERRATAFGAHATITGLALLPASIVAGVLWDHAGHAAPFVLGASFAVLAAILFAVLLPPGRETVAGRAA
jgi:MFS family permease